MKKIINFLKKPETDGDDLAIIVIGCIALASIVIMALLVTGN